jgi:hypothetical protein
MENLDGAERQEIGMAMFMLMLAFGSSCFFGF